MYDRHAEPIARFFLRRTGDRTASLDLTAETFCQAWFSLARFRDLAEGSAGPWLFGIARNVLRASVAKGRLESQARERLGLRRDEAPEVQPEARWVDGLHEALAVLPEQQRDAVALRILAELPYEQAAAVLGCSPGAARIRVSRALTTLRHALEGGET